MFCPKCGTDSLDENKRCNNCGFVLTENITDQESKEESLKSVGEMKFTFVSIKFTQKQIIACVLWVLALIVVILSFSAAHSVVSGGIEISEIQSVGGKTLEEAYYQELGAVFKGYAGIIRAFGLFMASILAYLGYNCFSKDN